MLLSMVSFNCDMLQVKKILIHQPKGFRYHFDQYHRAGHLYPRSTKNTRYH